MSNDEITSSSEVQPEIPVAKEVAAVPAEDLAPQAPAGQGHEWTVEALGRAAGIPVDDLIREAKEMTSKFPPGEVPASAMFALWERKTTPGQTAVALQLLLGSYR